MSGPLFVGALFKVSRHSSCGPLPPCKGYSAAPRHLTVWGPVSLVSFRVRLHRGLTANAFVASAVTIDLPSRAGAKDPTEPLLPEKADAPRQRPPGLSAVGGIPQQTAESLLPQAAAIGNLGRLFQGHLAAAEKPIVPRAEMAYRPARCGAPDRRLFSGGAAGCPDEITANAGSAPVSGPTTRSSGVRISASGRD